MNIFLTGGTGSIGSAVLAQAIAQGHTVTALARSAEAATRQQASGATPLLGDLAAPDEWTDQAAQADVVIHLASSFDANMALTEPRLIDSLSRAAAHRATPLRLLYTGGCWLYGATRSAVAHEGSPFTPPAAFTWASDAITQLCDTQNLTVATLHPAMVYDESGGVFSRYIKALRQGRPPTIWGDKNTRWPLVHRDDVAAAYLLLAGLPDTGAFNIVAEQGVPAQDITDALRAQAGIKAPAAVLPAKWVLPRHGIWAEGPMLDQQMRSSRMGGLGWSPRHTDFRKLHFDI